MSEAVFGRLRRVWVDA